MLAAVLVAGVVASCTIGQLAISPADVARSLLNAVGIRAHVDPIDDATLWAVRFPRTAMALVVGAALAVAGAVMQAVFANPLAEPGVVGVSSGAALGAAAAIVLGLTAAGEWTVALLAFAGGILATTVVYLTSRSSGRTEVVTLLLTGIAVNAFASAGLAFLLFAGTQSSREQVVFWQLGTIAGSRWPEVLVVAIVLAAGLAAALLMSRRLDLLALGERNARYLGVNVERLRVVAIVAVALLTGAAVAFCGIISFVGLVVPHVIRMAIGPSHRALIVASAIGGGALLVVADLIARTVVPAADLPIGMLTSLVGGPFFFALLWRQRRSSGGWA
ncbi:iron ABC transporter permease [Galbitalea sp. SE-J8]|uniref:FecCD family ABC transporter permease n=1 Tax=Galbitalea sp. SE-J8 TaxID=3054952 RepID=UPI00259CD5AA|nr:iron ABC transporter permease [Galbitalea sp. SE-J8]MDM4763940.1 iron ABC transporter permease [Galbitalea sp. SE-J8]